MRQKRKEYNFLSSVLNTNSISYRWSIPQRFFSTYAGQRFKINSIFRANDIMEKYGKNLQRNGNNTKEEKEEGKNREKGE